MEFSLAIDDVEYLCHGDAPLLARLYRPRGAGPFPLVVEVHGGWCRMSRESDAAISEPLARSGVVVAAMDFRMPPTATYPASLADINYGIRWCKKQAIALGSRPDLVGMLGTSSGGHQAMLAAMRPHDRRYAALPQPPGAADIDANVRFVVLCWPVIDSLGRYRYATTRRAAGAPYPAVLDTVVPLHERYWGSEAAMAEGSPTLALERGEQVRLPNVLYVQGTHDEAHPRSDLDRFVAHFRAAGGRVELELIEGQTQGFISRAPVSHAAAHALAQIIAFVHQSCAHS